MEIAALIFIGASFGILFGQLVGVPVVSIINTIIYFTFETIARLLLAAFSLLSAFMMPHILSLFRLRGFLKNALSDSSSLKLSKSDKPSVNEITPGIALGQGKAQLKTIYYVIHLMLFLYAAVIVYGAIYVNIRSLIYFVALNVMCDFFIVGLLRTHTKLNARRLIKFINDLRFGIRGSSSVYFEDLMNSESPATKAKKALDEGAKNLKEKASLNEADKVKIVSRQVSAEFRNYQKNASLTTMMLRRKARLKATRKARLARLRKLPTSMSLRSKAQDFTEENANDAFAASAAHSSSAADAHAAANAAANAVQDQVQAMGAVDVTSTVNGLIKVRGRKRARVVTQVGAEPKVANSDIVAPRAMAANESAAVAERFGDADVYAASLAAKFHKTSSHAKELKRYSKKSYARLMANASSKQQRAGGSAVPLLNKMRESNHGLKAANEPQSNDDSARARPSIIKLILNKTIGYPLSDMTDGKEQALAACTDRSACADHAACADNAVCDDFDAVVAKGDSSYEYEGLGSKNRHSYEQSFHAAAVHKVVSQVNAHELSAKELNDLISFIRIEENINQDEGSKRCNLPYQEELQLGSKDDFFPSLSSTAANMEFTLSWAQMIKRARAFCKRIMIDFDLLDNSWRQISSAYVAAEMLEHKHYMFAENVGYISTVVPPLMEGKPIYAGMPLSVPALLCLLRDLSEELSFVSEGQKIPRLLHQPREVAHRFDAIDDYIGDPKLALAFDELSHNQLKAKTKQDQAPNDHTANASAANGSCVYDGDDGDNGNGGGGDTISLGDSGGSGGGRGVCGGCGGGRGGGASASGGSGGGSGAKRHKLGDDLCLGFGFRWQPSHTRALHEKMIMGLNIAPEALKGSPDIHAVGMDNAYDPILLDQALMGGHTLLLGTTGAGKTRFMELILTQQILRHDTVIILDPKGDFGMQKTILRACRYANRDPFNTICCLDLSRPTARILDRNTEENLRMVGAGKAHNAIFNKIEKRYGSGPISEESDSALNALYQAKKQALSAEYAELQEVNNEDEKLQRILESGEVQHEIDALKGAQNATVLAALGCRADEVVEAAGKIEAANAYAEHKAQDEIANRFAFLSGLKDATRMTAMQVHELNFTTGKERAAYGERELALRKERERVIKEEIKATKKRRDELKEEILSKAQGRAPQSAGAANAFGTTHASGASHAAFASGDVRGAKAAFAAGSLGSSDSDLVVGESLAEEALEKERILMEAESRLDIQDRVGIKPSDRRKTRLNGKVPNDLQYKAYMGSHHEGYLSIDDEADLIFSAKNRGVNMLGDFEHCSELAERISAPMPGGKNSAPFKAFVKQAIGAAVHYCLLTHTKPSLNRLAQLISDPSPYLKIMHEKVYEMVRKVDDVAVIRRFNRLYGIKDPILRDNKDAVGFLLGKSASGQLSNEDMISKMNEVVMAYHIMNHSTIELYECPQHRKVMDINTALKNAACDELDHLMPYLEKTWAEPGHQLTLLEDAYHAGVKAGVDPEYLDDLMYRKVLVQDLKEARDDDHSELIALKHEVADLNEVVDDALKIKAGMRKQRRAYLEIMNEKVQRKLRQSYYLKAFGFSKDALVRACCLAYYDRFIGYELIDSLVRQKSERMVKLAKDTAKLMLDFYNADDKARSLYQTLENKFILSEISDLALKLGAHPILDDEKMLTKTGRASKRLKKLMVARDASLESYLTTKAHMDAWRRNRKWKNPLILVKRISDISFKEAFGFYESSNKSSIFTEYQSINSYVDEAINLRRSKHIALERMIKQSYKPLNYSIKAYAPMVVKRVLELSNDLERANRPRDLDLNKAKILFESGVMTIPAALTLMDKGNPQQKEKALKYLAVFRKHGALEAAKFYMNLWQEECKRKSTAHIKAYYERMTEDLRLNKSKQDAKRKLHRTLQKGLKRDGIVNENPLLKSLATSRNTKVHPKYFFSKRHLKKTDP